MKNLLIESILNEVTDYYSNNDNYTDDSSLGEYNDDNSYYADLFQQAKDRLNGTEENSEYESDEEEPIMESDIYSNNSNRGDMTRFAGIGRGYRH